MSPGSPRPATSVVRMSFIVDVLPRLSTGSASGRGVRQQRYLAGVLDRGGNPALVLRAVAGDPTGADLAAVGDEPPQQVGVLVVDGGRRFLAEGAHLLLGLANWRLGHEVSLSIQCRR